MNEQDIFDYSHINGSDDLRQAIRRLEARKALLEEELDQDFHHLLEGLRPANILRNTIHEVQQSTDLRHNLIKLALGLGAGYLSGKFVAGKSASLLKKAAGAALQYGITNFVAKKKDWQENNNGKPGKKSLLKRIFSV